LHHLWRPETAAQKPAQVTSKGYPTLLGCTEAIGNDWGIEVMGRLEGISDW